MKRQFDNYVTIYNGINTGDNPHSRARQSGKQVEKADMFQLIKTTFNFDIQNMNQKNFYLYDLLNYINNENPDPDLKQTGQNLSEAFLEESIRAY